MLVKAAQGLQVPREDNPREYITEDVADVPNTSYYRRRIMFGELIDMSDNVSDTPPAGTSANASKRKANS